MLDDRNGMSKCGINYPSTPTYNTELKNCKFMTVNMTTKGRSKRMKDHETIIKEVIKDIYLRDI